MDSLVWMQQIGDNRREVERNRENLILFEVPFTSLLNWRGWESKGPKYS